VTDATQKDDSILEAKALAHPIDFERTKRVPLILQSEMTECGLSCVGMISSYYGNRVNLPALRNKFHVSHHGMNLSDIVNVASQLQMTSRALQCELNELKDLSLPAILHWDLDHFVVLTAVKKNRISINDPARGKLTLSFEKASEHFTGFALELTPLSTFKKRDSRIIMRASDLWVNIVGLKRSLLSLFSISLVLQLLQLTTPYYTQWIVDKVLVTNDQSLLLVLAIAFSFLALAQVLTHALRSWVVLRIASLLSIQMGANLFSRLIRLPIDFFQKRHVGDVVSRFGSLVDIRNMLTNSVIEAIIDGIMAVLIVALMILYSTKLTLVVVTFLMLSFLVQWAFYYPNRKTQEELINDEAKEDSVFLESIRAIQTIKLYNQESHRSNLWLNRSADTINSSIRLAKLNISEQSLLRFISGLEMTIVMYIGALAVMAQTMSIGMLLAFIAYKQMFLASGYSLIDKLFEFKLLELHLERLSDIALHQTEKVSNDAMRVGSSLRGNLKVRNLSYCYSDNSEKVIKNISFDVEAGTSIAITGPSGCGKSTLTKIILRMLEFKSGTISFDNMDIKKFNLYEYRSKIGTVMQDDTLLSGTLVDNITMFQNNYDEEQLSECCRLAELDIFIKQLPMGFNTLVGEMGSSLSGGQIQRVLMARALYGKPDLLILDESTSYLDEPTMHKVNENLSRLNITRILIAHRKETIASADKIFVMEQSS
jgi:ATP-binding cassette subfamily B protein RaxB